MLMKFFAAVLPQSGNYSLFTLGNAKHVWATNLDRLVQFTEDRIDQQGVYFATAGYKEPGKRTQDNVQFLRSLRLDIDAGAKKFDKHPEGAYPTQPDALQAAVKFFKATGLKPTYVISSGEGLHVYFALDTDLTPAEWTPLAKRLGALCVEHGLKVDPTVTTDTARILRPIGTLHSNGARVSVLGHCEVAHSPAKLAEIMGVVAELATPPNKYANSSINDEIIEVVEGPPKSVVKIVANCPAMAEVAASKGDVPEPFWRAMIGVTKFTVEGLDMAHEMSSGYPGYDAAEVDKKYNAWATGPTSCNEFSKHTTACATCPHHGKIKSPISLGYMTDKQIEELPAELQPEPAKPPKPTGDYWDGCLPPKFSVVKDKDGKLVLLHATVVEKKDELGDMVKVPVVIPVTNTIFWLTHWIESEHADDKAQAMLSRYDPKHKIVRPPVPMDQSIVPNRMKLLEFLAKQSIQLLSTKAANSMDEYIRAQLQRIQMMSRRPKIAQRFGLRIQENGDLISAHGKYVIQPDGSIIEGMLTDDLRSKQARFPLRALPPSEVGEWDSTVWASHIIPAAHRYAKFMRDHYGDPALRKYQLAIMLGIASPLMAFVEGSYYSGIDLPANGLSISLLSQRGGKGKTSLMRAIMMAYGDPVALVRDSSKLMSTNLARADMPPIHGTMPCAMDEIGKTDDESAAGIVSAIANGTGRTTMKQHGGSNTQPNFALINLIATNRSVRDMIVAADDSSDAIQTRLLEVTVNTMNFDQDARDAFTNDWADVQRECPGAFGAVLERAICRKGAAAMNKLVTKAVSLASREMGAPQEGRFQYRGLGALIAAHGLLDREGLALFSLRDMVEEFRLAFDAGTVYAAETTLPSDGLELTQIMLNDLKPRTLMTLTETHRGHDKTKFDVMLNAKTPDVVLARHITGRGYTYVSGSAVREWCVEKKVSERDMVVALKNCGVLLAPYPNKPKVFSIPTDLFKGTQEAGGSIVRCYKLDVTKLYALLGWGGDVDMTNVLALTPKPQPDPQEPAQPQEKAE